MKYLQLLLPAVVLFSGSCRKPYYPPRNFTSIHTGKVIAAVCGSVIVQFTDGSPYGQNDWTSYISSSSIPLNHVFKVANACTWGGADVNADIRFRFVPMAAQPCFFCKAYIPTPDTAYSIEVIK